MKDEILILVNCNLLRLAPLELGLRWSLGVSCFVRTAVVADFVNAYFSVVASCNFDFAAVVVAAAGGVADFAAVAVTAAVAVVGIGVVVGAAVAFGAVENLMIDQIQKSLYSRSGMCVVTS